MKNIIYIEPIGGLANRIRVVANGIWLKREFNAILFIIWNENDELNCPYDKMFESIPDFTVLKKYLKYNYVTRSAQDGIKNKLKAKIKNMAIGIDYCLTDPDFPSANVCEIVKNHKRVYIKTCQRFTLSENEFKLLKPLSILSHKIDDFFKTYNNNIIGVQIRRTDNSESIIKSPTELFIKRMTELILEDKNLRFFLATDDASVETELIEIFGDKIITYQKELSRKTNAGIQFAVLDIFILSKTKKILGSYWSSFSEVAAWIGDIDLEVIKKD